MLVDCDGVQRLRRLTRGRNTEIMVCPAVVYEMLRTRDPGRRDSQLKAATLGAWTRMRTEVYAECEDFRRVAAALRPHGCVKGPISAPTTSYEPIGRMAVGSGAALATHWRRSAEVGDARRRPLCSRPRGSAEASPRYGGSPFRQPAAGGLDREADGQHAGMDRRIGGRVAPHVRQSVVDCARH